jgi:hypothetical protein
MFTPESLAASSLLPKANLYRPGTALVRIKLATIAVPNKNNTAFGMSEPGKILSVTEPIFWSGRIVNWTLAC